MRVNGVLVCTHGSFGVELVKSAEMIVGRLDRVKTLSLLPDMAPEDFGKAAEEELKNLKPGKYICFVDLLGGTPFNVLAALRNKYNLVIITGVNLPMFMEVYDHLDDMEADELAEYAVNILKESGRVVHAVKSQEGLNE